MPVVAERVPRAGVTEKLTVSPGIGFPLTVKRAVTREDIVEFAATIDGAAVNERTPELIVTDVDLDVSCQVAVTIAVPMLAPAVRVTVAIPLALVFAVYELRYPIVVAKLT